MPARPRGGIALALVTVAFVAACPSGQRAPVDRPPPRPRTGTITLSILGTNDLHGAIDRLPILAGYVANLRAARADDGGQVLVVDAGDMFQGTLGSNLNEGVAVVAAYNAIGYDAAAIGNHEFDFGPSGPAVTASGPHDDPRGALRARAAEAAFPFLMANVLDVETGKRPTWDNVLGSFMLEKGPVVVGVIGVTTEATPFTTMPANFVGLAMAKPVLAIAAEAADLRKRGAQVVVVAAHVGSKCADLHDPSDLSSCDQEEELFTMVDALQPGAVDVIVAGHTHAAMAHRLGEVAVIESYSSGRAFGRVDLRINEHGVITGKTIHQPRDLCPEAGGEPVPAAACVVGDYEGRPVMPSAAIAALIEPAQRTAAEVERKPLGVTFTTAIPRAYDLESAEGNLFADLMRAAVPKADLALTNGGGLRADMPAGPLTYGALYEAMPFDNRFALVTLTGAHVRKMISNNLQSGSGIFSWSGLRVTASCTSGTLEVFIKDERGKPIADDRTLTLVTSDFLASGGDGVIGRLKLPDGAVTLTDTIIRDAIAAQLTARGGALAAFDVFDPDHPRLAYPPPRPVRCGAAARPRP
ncbi:MAG: 5'-nucleotidase C-terminal domain-containing protein [Myxococcales bacterium]|nr:5'-nucleotidase C-terminal domain-containing protein [Myxococcales bacterium]